MGIIYSLCYDYIKTPNASPEKPITRHARLAQSGRAQPKIKAPLALPPQLLAQVRGASVGQGPEPCHTAAHSKPSGMVPGAHTSAQNKTRTGAQQGLVPTGACQPVLRRVQDPPVIFIPSSRYPCSHPCESHPCESHCAGLTFERSACC